MIHDAEGCIRRPWSTTRWICCRLEFKGWWRPVMQPNRWTHLFFLDEAVAIAAGHRPCAECQRERFNDFRQHWAAANPELARSQRPLVETIDSALHRERISQHFFQRDKRKITYTEQLNDIPDGTLVLLEARDGPHLVLGDALYRWSFEGYGHPSARTAITVQVLTPPSTVRVVWLPD